jgi:diguanylate cyclase (GGDEF)-like protein/PAS domain S-box-containing protein
MATTRERVSDEHQRAREGAYRLLFEGNPQPMYVFDVGTLEFLAVNDAAVENYGWTRQEFLAMTIRDIRPPEDVEAVESDIEREGGGERYARLWRHCKKDGTLIDVQVRAHSLRFDGRDAWLVLATDVTEQRRAEDALRRSEERFRLLAENAPDFIFRFRVQPDPGFDYVSPAALTVLGYSPEDLYGDPGLVTAIVGEEYLAETADFGHDPRLTEPRDVRVRRKDGTMTWVEQRLTPVFVDDHLMAVEGIARDISERKRAEAAMAYQALHDGLTQLPNRFLLLDRLSQALARTARDDSLVAVLMLDLDRFKFVNDSLGHPAGDDLLVGVARNLREAVRPGDTVARLGGDEFVVLCEGVSSDAHARVLGERLAALVGGAYPIAGTEVFTSASVGVALGRSGASTEDLLSDADAAMYLAKEKGRGRVELFRPLLRSRAESRLAAESALRQAVDQQQFVLCYQPIVDLEGGWIVGAEALLRWRRPDDTVVIPADFVPLAEETGLIVPIGAWVVAEACLQLRAWRDAFPHVPLTTSVNLSARQLTGELVDVLTKALASAGLDPAALTLEITEGVLMDDTESALEALLGLKAVGVTLAIDDFGTGYSSLSYLKRFPIDTLKIDRSFVAGLGGDDNDRAIVAGVLAMAKGLRVDVVAEGVETADQLRALRVLGCPRAQGYHFAPPAPAADFEALLRRSPRW